MLIQSSALLLLIPLACRGDQFYNNNNAAGGDGFYNQNMNGNANGVDLNTDDYMNGMGGDGGGMAMEEKGDDFMSSIGDYGATMATMMFGQCFEGIDMEAMMENPFEAVDQRCSAAESQTFQTDLDEFETCSGFDLKELIETFGSVYIGILLNCGSYVMDAVSLFDNLTMDDMERLKAQETPFPRVPQECVEALVGDNPFGRSFLYMDEFPEREMKCFAELSKTLPTCTLSEWPIPIVGSWLKAVACIYGSLDQVLMPMVEEQCQGELTNLAACLPAAEEIKPANCKDIRTKCIFDFEMPVISMLVPPPFWGPPMAKQCKTFAETAENPSFEDLAVVELYETFRNVCVPANDRAIWDIPSSVSDSNSQTTGDGGASVLLKAAAEEKGASGATTVTSSPSSSKFGFLPGLLSGMIVAFAAMIGLRKMQGKDIVPLGYGFDSLELTEPAPRGFA